MEFFKSFWTRLKEVLKLGRSEVGDFAKSFFRPSGSDIILEILIHLSGHGDRRNSRENGSQ